MTLKLLLLDRPADKDMAKKRDIEFFGPWAQPISFPSELKKPSLDPYPSSESVYDAGVRSVRKAQDVLGTLSEVMPELTGVEGKSSRFWKALAMPILET